MLGTFDHSPAEVVRKALIDAGYGVDAEYEGSGTALRYTGEPWPVFFDGGPDKPDSAIFVKKTAGVDFGRLQLSGRRLLDHGVQIMVRAANQGNGLRKAQTIAAALDEDENLHRVAVAIGDADYWIERFERAGDVLELGKDVPSAHGRRTYTVNALVALRQLQP